MTTYRANGISCNRVQALSLFVSTCRLGETNLMTAVKAWSNGADTADTVAGRQLRETVRKTSNVRIFSDADERAAWAGADAATLWALFKDERSVAISAIKAKSLGAVDFAVSVLAELRDWLGDNYAVDAATRESWLTTNQTALSLAITQLQAA